MEGATMSWIGAMGRGLLIVSFFFAAVVWIPNLVVEVDFVASASSWVRDGAVVTVWGVGFVGGLFLLRIAQRRGSGGRVAAMDRPERRESIGIVGGGPAGLSAAHDLRLRGYQVTVYEATQILGGMMVLGIPEYRLPPPAGPAGR